MPDIQAREAKATARAALKGILYGLPSSYRGWAARRIVESIRGTAEFNAATEIHCYWPASDGREIDTRALIETALDAGHRVFLPRILAYQRRTGDIPRIGEAEFTSTTQLADNRWGIGEPVGVPSRPFGCDLAIVPGLGTGLNGIRVGHGWGYYDELLKNAGVPILFPCFDACVLEAVEALPSDVPVSQIVTESRIIVTNRPPRRNKH